MKTYQYLPVTNTEGRIYAINYHNLNRKHHLYSHTSTRANGPIQQSHIQLYSRARSPCPNAAATSTASERWLRGDLLPAADEGLVASDESL